MCEKQNWSPTTWAIIFLAFCHSFPDSSKAQEEQHLESFDLRPLELLCVDTRKTHRASYHLNVVDVVQQGILVRTGPRVLAHDPEQLEISVESASWLLPTEQIQRIDEDALMTIRAHVANGRHPKASALLQLDAKTPCSLGQNVSGWQRSNLSSEIQHAKHGCHLQNQL